MLTRYRTWSPASKMMDRYLNRTWDDDCGPNCNCNPSVNITETDEAYTIDVAAPGLEKKDFNVTIDDHPLVPSSMMRGVPTLTISTSQESKSEESKGKVNRREFSYSSFKRMFTLPDNVRQDKVTSTYENGILRIVLPKTEESKPKSVEVKVN